MHVVGKPISVFNFCNFVCICWVTALAFKVTLSIGGSFLKCPTTGFIHPTFNFCLWENFSVKNCEKWKVLTLFSILFCYEDEFSKIARLILFPRIIIYNLNLSAGSQEESGKNQWQTKKRRLAFWDNFSDNNFLKWVYRSELWTYTLPSFTRC